MRLIDTATLELHEFFGKHAPLYAILSHRWEEDEVTFQDFRGGRGPEMRGWSKVTGCCAQAAKDGWQYVVSLHQVIRGSLFCLLGLFSSFYPLMSGWWQMGTIGFTSFRSHD